MESSKPRVTVLMPVYNAEKYIAEAIRSVLDQTFRDFELLIVNDGSTDNSVKIIRSFDDPRIVLLQQENKGIAAALNAGLALSRAEYIARFDADDICYPHRLRIQYDFMQAWPEYDIVGSAADYMDLEGYYIFTQRPAAYLNEEIQALQYMVCPFIHSSVFYKKAMILSKGGYNEHAYTFEDHFLWVNMLADTKAWNLSEPLISVRLNPDSITIDEKWRSRKFREIKYHTLRKRSITADQGRTLQAIAGLQYSPRIKQGAYYALCCKKFLVNNYQPEKARQHVIKAIIAHPLRADNYLLYVISYFPERVINWLHNL